MWRSHLTSFTDHITKQTHKLYPNLKTWQKISPCDVSKQPTNGNLYTKAVNKKQKQKTLQYS